MTRFEMAKLLVLLGRIADSLEHLADKATGVEVDAVELVEQRQLREACNAGTVVMHADN
jgi:hypothetical protein